jgi:integrase/recombinase XerD
MVQKALGHATIATTMIYTHIVDDDMEAAMREFNI